jgi:hypothetical protein
MRAGRGVVKKARWSRDKHVGKKKKTKCVYITASMCTGSLNSTYTQRPAVSENYRNKKFLRSTEHQITIIRIDDVSLNEHPPQYYITAPFIDKHTGPTDFI